ncbi:hypothetical protein Q3G72_026961 [Acer saccharum]|nr:hypothetical protein Q3G72_026961 [Acer saccharum]
MAGDRRTWAVMDLMVIIIKELIWVSFLLLMHMSIMFYNWSLSWNYDDTVVISIICLRGAVTLVGFYREKEEGQSGSEQVKLAATVELLYLCMLFESMKSAVECSTIESNVLLEHAMTLVVDGSSIIQLAVLPWQASDLLEAYAYEVADTVDAFEDKADDLL